MSLFIINPGLLTTVQDAGRIGYQQYGVPVSGAVDCHAAAVANILVGNPSDEAVLECTMLGPKLRFDAAECIAITGGDLSPTLDGKPVPTYQAIKAEAGQTLAFGALKSGCRAFLAFAGGLNIPPVMGSRSTYMKAKIGGYQGRKLEKGDNIPFRAPANDLPHIESRRAEKSFAPQDEYLLRVVLGPQDDAFSAGGLNTFLSEIYTVTPEFDRMGCRLDGALIEHKDGGDIISDGIAMGAIQVPTAGKPIIMLSDRQTTGGYAKIASVITADFPILAQLKSGDRVKFAAVSVQAAQKELLAQRKELKELRDKIEAAG